MDRLIIKYVLPLNLFFDLSSFFFEERGGFAMVRGIVNFTLIVYVVLKYRYLWRYFTALILFATYIAFNLIFSSDFTYSLGVSMKVVLSMFYYVVGFALVSTREKLEILSKSLVVVYGLLIVNFLVSNVLKLGDSSYTNEVSFYNGNLRDSWNLFTYSVLISPLLLSFYSLKSRKKGFVFLLAFVNGVIAILSLKRIAIFVLTLGLVMNGILRGAISKIASSALVIGLLALAAFPLYKETLLIRFESREDRFERSSFEEEARYLETFYVWDETLSFNDPLKSIFGFEAFNSAGNYANGRFGIRQLHVDYNLMLNTIGIIGLFLYFLFFYQVASIYFKYKPLKSSYSNSVTSQMNVTFIVLLISQFITSLAGQMYSLTFRSMIFIFLGGILGVFVRERVNVSKSS